MVQWEKIVELDRIFQCNKHFTSFQFLRREIGCSRATLFRLLDKLEHVLYAPLERNKQKGYRYNIKDGEKFELPGLWFNPKELEALVCLEYAFMGLQQGFLHEILNPLEKKFEPLLKAQGIKTKAWQERFKIVPIGSRKIKPGIFELVSDAVLHEKQIKIQYCKLGCDITSTRIISPQTLLRYRDNWYLDAWCHKAEDHRTFSLNRITHVENTNRKSKNIPRTDLDKFYKGSYGIFSGQPTNIATIKFTGTAAKEVSQEEWHPSQQGELKDDGTYILKIPYNNSLELVMDVLRWGDEAEIIDPPKLRNNMALRLKNASDKYFSSIVS